MGGSNDSASEPSKPPTPSVTEGGCNAVQEHKQQDDEIGGVRGDCTDGALDVSRLAAAASTMKEPDATSLKPKSIEQSTGASLVGNMDDSAGLESKSGSAEDVSLRSVFDTAGSIPPGQSKPDVGNTAPEKSTKDDDAQGTSAPFERSADDQSTVMIEETPGSDIDHVLLTCVPITTNAEGAPAGSGNSSDSSASDDEHSSGEKVEEGLNQAARVASRVSSMYDGTVRRDHDPQIGDRVYACFDENDERGWYWGNTSGHEDGFYSIRFEDNDYAEKVSRENPNHILTVWEYIHIYETDPPPVKENDEIVKTLSPRQMYASRCKWCALCKKRDCGSCTSCRNNKGVPHNAIIKRQACLQKMCLHLSESQKKQPAEGILPPGWTFMFTKDERFASGLVISRPESAQSFRSIEGAAEWVPSLKENNPSVVDDFNAHVGVIGGVRANCGNKKPAVPSGNISGEMVLSFQDMYDLRCKKCEQCIKPNCGSCMSCRRNKKNPRRRQRVCEENICLEIPKSQMEHVAKGMPSGEKQARATTSDRGPPIHNLMLLPASLSPREMYARRCNDCELCKKPECGSCASCTNNKSASTDDEREVCLQKMCLKIPELEKKLHAKGMPRDWTFIFTRNKRYKGRRSYVPGLIIFHPGYTTLTYRSAEAAVQQVPELMRSNPNVVADFYDHIGIKPSDMVASVQSSPKEAMETEFVYREVRRVPKPKRHSPVERISLDAVIANNGPCGMCKNCTKEACGECSRCKNRPDGTNPQCFQKMCYQIPVEAKAEPAVGFPLGWKFYFAEDPDGGGTYAFEPVPGLFILSKGGKKFRSVEAAVDICSVGDESDVARKFYTHVGLPSELESCRERRPQKRQRTMAITDYSLPGRGVRFEWTDLSGHKKVMYGEVAHCEVNENGEVPIDRFKVILSPLSSHGVAALTESRVLPLPLILGGCISLEQQIGGKYDSALMKQLRNQYEYLNWIVPEMRHEESVVNGDGIRLPRLTLIVRGFLLMFHVKPSSIPNAGYGVFLNCIPMTKGPDGRPMGPFMLEAGNMVDMGVYGPFRLQDKKLQAVFFAKNFIFFHECEEWVHQAGDSRYQLDITDDRTGEIHEEAKNRILAYVNESSALGRVCIRAEHDAEDNVHYLLGHEHQSQGSFTVPSDGSEIELFAHYLDGYEKVRIRKGYSFLPYGEERNRLLEEIANDDVDDIGVMNGYDAADVKAVLGFLSENFLIHDRVECSSKIVGRLLVVASILQRRVKQLRCENDSNLNLQQESRNLVSLLLTMIPDEDGKMKGLQADGNVDEVLLCILKINFSADEVSKIAKKLSLEPLSKFATKRTLETCKDCNETYIRT